MCATSKALGTSGARLPAVSPSPGRAEATRAALIPVRKASAWWDLAQDERRALIEERSHHIAIGLEYLPAIARRLYHSRDLESPNTPCMRDRIHVGSSSRKRKRVTKYAS